MSSVSELKSRAKQMGIKGYSKMNKDSLLKALGTEVAVETGKSLSELKAMAKAQKIRGFSKMSKASLLEALEKSKSAPVVEPIEPKSKGVKMSLKRSDKNLVEARVKKAEAAKLRKQEREQEAEVTKANAKRLAQIEKSMGREPSGGGMAAGGDMSAGGGFGLAETKYAPMPTLLPAGGVIEAQPSGALNQPVAEEERAKVGAGVDMTDEKAPVKTKKRARVAGIKGGTLSTTAINSGATDRAGEEDNQGFHDDNIAVPQNTVEAPETLVKPTTLPERINLDIPLGGNHPQQLPMAKSIQPRSIKDYKVDVAYRTSRAQANQGIY